jgi:hypothetical protein
MNCQDFQDRLQLFLDGASGADGAACERHAEDCPVCREWLNAAQALLVGLRSQPRPETPLRLTDHIVERIVRDRRESWRSRRRLWSAALAAGVGFLLCTGYLWIKDRRSPLPEVPTAAADHLASALPTPTPDPPAVGSPRLSLDASVAEARSALGELVAKPAEDTLGPGRLLIPDKVDPLPVPSVQGWEQALAAAPQSWREAGQGVSAGLEPMAHSARRAVQTWFDDLPPMGAGP